MKSLYSSLPTDLTNNNLCRRSVQVLADSASHDSKEVAAEAVPWLWEGEAAMDDGSDLEPLSSLVQEEAMLPPWFGFHIHPNSGCPQMTMGAIPFRTSFV
jgi:hypothetical protein